MVLLGLIVDPRAAAGTDELIGRVWIKARASRSTRFRRTPSPSRDIARHFEHSLASTEDLGIVICDARQQAQDILVGHSSK